VLLLAVLPGPLQPVYKHSNGSSSSSVSYRGICYSIRAVQLGPVLLLQLLVNKYKHIELIIWIEIVAGEHTTPSNSHTRSSSVSSSTAMQQLVLGPQSSNSKQVAAAATSVSRKLNAVSIYKPVPVVLQVDVSVHCVLSASYVSPAPL
jgi:hypothetical protein